ncbi:P-loop containing nucleoside triphosphate hydrolase protein [Mycena pura]|uniref:P-loop containing nucleoside triphosphate hydrolase protein n=1 Tax=Mycena pura TaxID=153505 RepID=A0AAD6V0R5_9AGAR|nr:P-loop containing nucleoside triphosphate hydrolase protein [Mycena pura]
MPTKVIIIGIGGATSSGKTTLANHVHNCLHNSIVIHQDDFVPPAEKLPKDPEFGFVNWDDAPGAIEWDRMASFLRDLKKTGYLPSDHQSYDSFNENAAVPVDDQMISEWKKQSEQFVAQHLQNFGVKLVFAVVDGFLLYWDKRITSNFDIQVFLRVPEDVAKARRAARSYYTPEGEIWCDPPQYWEKVAWPAYVRAHENMFEGKDVTAGRLKGDFLLFEGMEMKMEDMVNSVMKKILGH